MKILVEIFFSHSRKIKELEDMKINVDWISGSTSSYRGQSMKGTKYLQIV